MERANQEYPGTVPHLLKHKKWGNASCLCHCMHRKVISTCGQTFHTAPCCGQIIPMSHEQRSCFHQLSGTFSRSKTFNVTRVLWLGLFALCRIESRPIFSGNLHCGGNQSYHMSDCEVQLCLSHFLLCSHRESDAFSTSQSRPTKPWPTGGLYIFALMNH